jgi:hypothetical protein
VTTGTAWRWLSYSDLDWALFIQELFRLLGLIAYAVAALLVMIAFLWSRRSAAARLTRDDDEDFVWPRESTEDDAQWETRS